MKEIWKDVKGFEGLYRISSLGEVKSLTRIAWNGHVFHELKGRVLKPFFSGKYLSVSLRKDGKSHRRYVHRLVAESFLINNEDKPQVNHIDGDKQNNKLVNLEWCTPKENMAHAIKTGLYKNIGSLQHLSKLKHEDVVKIKTRLKNNRRGLISEIAREYNVTFMTISLINKGMNWKHVKV